MISSARKSIVLAGAASVVVATVLALTIVQWSAEPGRWFMPGSLGHEPAATPIRIAVGGTAARRTDRPPAGFITRAIGLRTREEQAWGERNGVTSTINFSHNLSEVFPPALATTRPEFFPWFEGARFRPSPELVNWNPDLGREDTASYAAERAKEYFAQHPGEPAFSLGINDALNFGESPETVALVTPLRWFRGRPDFSPLVFTFMNRAASDVASRYPDKYLGCLAYYWCENVPPFAVDSHVIPFLCADRTQSYDPAFQREELDLQRRWANTVGAGRFASHDRPPRRLGLYDYLDGYGFLVPRVPIHALAEHIRHAAQVGFTDYYGESSRNWSLDGPLPWVIVQLLQDPSLNVEGLLEEYYREYFREAREPMRRFFARCEEQWMTQSGPSYWLKHYRNESQAVLFPTEVCRELRDLLNEAARRATTTRVKQRIAFVAAGFGVTERFSAFQNVRTELGRTVLRRQLEGEAGQRLLREYLARRDEFVHYTKATVQEWPLAFNPINYDDFLRNDPSFAAAAVLGSIDAPTAHVRNITSQAEGVQAALAIAASKNRSASREVAANGRFEGPLRRGRRIVGLPYGIDLPAPWQSRVEPSEFNVSEIRHTMPATWVSPNDGLTNQSDGPARLLRIGGAENTTVFEWVPAKAGSLYAASVWARGLVSNSDAVTLTLGWLDAKKQHIGTVVVMRLPDGNWPEWVQLQQGARAPADAAWVGIGIRVQHQVAPDWVEFRDFSLREIPDTR